MHMTVKTLCLQVFTEVIGLCLSLGVGGGDISEDCTGVANCYTKPKQT